MAPSHHRGPPRSLHEPNDNYDTNEQQEYQPWEDFLTFQFPSISQLEAEDPTSYLLHIDVQPVLQQTYDANSATRWPTGLSASGSTLPQQPWSFTPYNNNHALALDVDISQHLYQQAVAPQQIAYQQPSPLGDQLDVRDLSMVTAEGSGSSYDAFLTGPWTGAQPFEHASPATTNLSDSTVLGSSVENSPTNSAAALASPSPPFDGPNGVQGRQLHNSHSVGSRTVLSHGDQLKFFYEARSLSMRNAGLFIPQPMYAPTTRADQRRYVDAVECQPPIYFLRTDGDYGIPLSTALRRRTSELADPSQRVFDGVQPSVSIRLEWPGYRSWTRQIPTKDFRKVQMPITREKLAKEIAKCVQRFIKERQQHPITGDAQLRAWRIGDLGIKLEDLVLVSMHHVSRGSWQPQLRLRAPRTF